MFYNKTSEEYLDDNIINFYKIYAETGQKKDIYRVYFSHSYQDFLNYLYNEKVCEFIESYNSSILMKILHFIL